MGSVQSDRQPELSVGSTIQLLGLRGLIEEATKNMTEAAALVLALLEAQAATGGAAVIADAPDIPYWAEILAAAADTGMDPLVLAGLIQAESSFIPDKPGEAGERGLCQIMPPAWYEVMPESYERAWEPALNILAGARYWRKQWGRLDERPGELADHLWWTFVAYNAGPGRADRWVGTYELEHIPSAIATQNLRNYRAGVAWARKRGETENA